MKLSARMQGIDLHTPVIRKIIGRVPHTLLSSSLAKVASMNCMRLILIACAVFLGGCSIAFDRSEPLPNPLPDANQQKAIAAQIMRTVEQMKGAKGVALSEVGANLAQSGPEQWTQCARVEFPSRSLYYTFFVRGEKVIESRSSVLNDGCEARDYRAYALGSSSSVY